MSEERKKEESLLALEDVPVILSKLVKILLEMKIFITLSSNFPTNSTRNETKGGRASGGRRRKMCGKILIKTLPFVFVRSS